jgi:hypothetical protein
VWPGKNEADRDLNAGTRAHAAQIENRCAATKNGRTPCSREEKQNRPAGELGRAPDKNESGSQIRQTALARNAKITPAQPPEQSREALDENKNESHHFTSGRIANNSIYHRQNSSLLHRDPMPAIGAKRELETGLRATTGPKTTRETGPEQRKADLEEKERKSSRFTTSKREDQ